MKHIVNFPTQQQHQNMFGKRILESKELNSSSVSNQFVGAQKLTGTRCGMTPKKGLSKKSQRRSEYRVIGLSGALPLTMLIPSLLKELVTYSGVQLEQVNPEEPGMRQVWVLSVKTREVNSGADIAVRNLLSSMNLEGRLQSITYSDGSIGTLSTWSSRDLVPLSSPKLSGLHPTSPQSNGTPIVTPSPSPR